MQAGFFDVDDTLISLKSMFRFQRYYFLHAAEHRGEDGNATYTAFEQALRNHPRRDDRAVLNRLFYQSFAGRQVDQTEQLAAEWFEWESRRLGDRLWIPETLSLLTELRTNGARIVLVSGSCNEILAPIVKRLGGAYCLATQLKAVNGRFTGEIDGRQMIGPGKAEAIVEFARHYKLDLAQCLGCGDHLSDVPMLELTGEVRVVPGEPSMEEEARRRDWPLLDVSPSELPGTRDSLTA
ncbi:MAG: HAD-IB family hydrolase [Aquisalimonadaceae bacterium]